MHFMTNSSQKHNEDNHVYPLIAAEIKQAVRVVSFTGGHGMEQKLRQLGLMPGDCAVILRHAPFGGPILIRVNDREIAIGKGVAKKILVRNEKCDSH